MKKVMLLILFTASMSGQNKPYAKAEHGKTNYKSGFVYYDSRSIKCTLVKWVKIGMDYRWRTKFEAMGEVAYGYTDDCWIDLYTEKAFLNEQTHKITYYEDVNITLKKL